MTEGLFRLESGIRMAGMPLWLDARSRVQASVVSHAHLDHARRHHLVIASKKTVRLLETRLGKSKSVGLAPGEPWQFGNCQVTLYPAGHILGSTQILVEQNGVRLLYSGDINTAAGATAEPIEYPECDVLIMESTFGDPFYRFPPREEIIEQLLDFVHRALRAGEVPIVFGYVLGKSQELMQILGQAGFQLSVHGSIARLARIYESYGMEFGNWQKFRKQELEGKVVIMPRITLKTRLLKKIENRRTLFPSGWAMRETLRQRYQVDAALPLSDHADFDGLVEYARRVRPKKIYVTHGFSKFADHLRDIGFDAAPLDSLRERANGKDT